MIELKYTHKWRAIVVMALATLACQPARSAITAGDSASSVAAASASQRWQPLITNDEVQVLALWRQAYADLEQARQAALNRQREKVRAEVQLAWSFVSLPRPYWKGGLEAVESALVDVHGVTEANAWPLLGPYTDTASASALWPQFKHSEINYLDGALWALSKLQNGAALAADAHRLMRKDFRDADIKQPIKANGQRITTERAAWRERMFEEFIATRVG
jgi:hypothetical protein